MFDRQILTKVPAATRVRFLPIALPLLSLIAAAEGLSAFKQDGEP